MDPDGVGWGLLFEEPPPVEPEEEDADAEPHPGRRVDAAMASAPWMVCRRWRENNPLRKDPEEPIVHCFLWCSERVVATPSIVSVTEDCFLPVGGGTYSLYLFRVDAGK